MEHERICNDVKLLDIARESERIYAPSSPIGFVFNISVAKLYALSLS